MEEAHMFLLLCCCAAASAIAVPASSYVPLAKEDYETLRNLPRGRAGILPGFSYIFVESGGKITRTRNDSAIQVEIAGSPKVQDHALDVAAGLLVKMTEFMDPNIFSNMAHNMSIGIFSAREKLIIYPEYKYLASGDCGSSCSGKCSSTCTFDGRKYEDLAGVGVAAGLIVKMTQFMDPGVFKTMGDKVSVGIFSAREKLTVFPEYKQYANGDCGSSCSGKCSKTCTFDGRKYENLAGLGGSRAMVLDENVLCTAKDPYYGRENILLHEITHSIHIDVLDDALKRQILKTYNNAVAKKLWTTSYAMKTQYEYFAIAVTVYLGVDKNSRVNTGGMNICGNVFCKTETENRRNLESHDPELVKIIAHVYSKDDHDLLLNITTCPSPSDLAGK